MCKYMCTHTLFSVHMYTLLFKFEKRSQQQRIAACLGRRGGGQRAQAGSGRAARGGAEGARGLDHRSAEAPEAGFGICRDAAVGDAQVWMLVLPLAL